MQETRLEKLRKALKRAEARHVTWSWVYRLLWKMASFVCTFGLVVSHNLKRLAFLGAFPVYLMMTTSFTFPLLETEVLPEESMEVLVEQENKTYQRSDEDSAQDETGITEYIEDDQMILNDHEVYEVDEDFSEIDLDQAESVDVDAILESHGQLGQPSDEASKVDIKQDMQQDMELSKDDWNLILINKQHPVPEDYEFPLGTIYGDMKCDERVIDELLAMLKDAKEDGITLVINSPYRDYQLQSVLFERKIEKYMENGLSYLEAYCVASQTVTVPGASEHQIGLAFDITCDTYTKLLPAFGDTDAGIWLQKNCMNYGFILRYPEGKEYITGINYEPWHFRYVGVKAATYISKEEITLEELWDSLDQ